MAGASHITIANRTGSKAEALAAHVRNQTGVLTEPVTWSGEFRCRADTQVLVNSTSIALAPNVDDVVPIDYGTLAASTLVCDVIPNPPDTPFLKKARASGATTLDGLGMLVYQGAIAFKMWTGEDAPVDVMRGAWKRYLLGKAFFTTEAQSTQRTASGYQRRLKYAGLDLIRLRQGSVAGGEERGPRKSRSSPGVAKRSR